MTPFTPDLTSAIAAWEALTDEEQAIQKDAFFDLIESGRTAWGSCLADSELIAPPIPG